MIFICPIDIGGGGFVLLQKLLLYRRHLFVLHLNRIIVFLIGEFHILFVQIWSFIVVSSGSVSASVLIEVIVDNGEVKSSAT